MPDANQTAICVAGMHRSGTSMITRLLNLCGMDLGAEGDMMPASDANPEGYWEHIWFNYYNNQILDFLGGAWDLVPVYPENWQNTAGIQWVKREASVVIARFKGPIWGWKDPRNSITLPFWRQLIPGLKTVVCVRNPLDVANSLNKRGSSSTLFGLQLWWQYSSMVLLDTLPKERVVTHFDVYFRDGKTELRRLLGALGMEAREGNIEQACSEAKVSLRHSFTGLEKLQKACPWPGLMHTYCKLLMECGDLCRDTLGEQEQVAELAAQWTPESCCMPTVATTHSLHRMTAKKIADAQARVDAMQKQLVAAQECQRDLREQLGRATDAIVQASAQRDHAMEQLAELAGENQAIKQSRSFRILVKASALGLKTGLIKPAKK